MAKGKKQIAADQLDMAELRQSQNHAGYMKLIGWKVEQSPQGIRAYIRPLPLTGLAVMKIQRVPWEKLDFNWVKWLSKKYRIVTTYIEVDKRVKVQVNQTPDYQVIGRALDTVVREMKKRGYKPLSLGMVASKTQTIKLNQSENKLLAQMKPKTRYNIGLAKKRNLKIVIWTGKAIREKEQELKTYLKLIKMNNKRVHYWGGQESWIKAQLKTFGEQAYVITVTDAYGKWLAASLFLVADETSYYAHNGSTEQGRKDMAPSLVVWEGMREAKRRGLNYLDFDGVYDERYPVKRWLGYTRFKKGFGGTYVYYPPAFVKWLTWWR